MSIELLDAIHAKGLVASQEHFETLIRCIDRILPEGVRDTIPKTLDEVTGLFSASTKEFHLTILHDKPGYEALTAVFEYQISDITSRGNWLLKKFSVLIGGEGMFSMPKEYTATCIEDALVLSKRIAKYLEKYATEAVPMPETATMRPN